MGFVFAVFRDDRECVGCGFIICSHAGCFDARFLVEVEVPWLVTIQNSYSSFQLHDSIGIVYFIKVNNQYFELHLHFPTSAFLKALLSGHQNC